MTWFRMALPPLATGPDVELLAVLDKLLLLKAAGELVLLPPMGAELFLAEGTMCGRLLAVVPVIAVLALAIEVVIIVVPLLDLVTKGVPVEGCMGSRTGG